MGDSAMNQLLRSIVCAAAALLLTMSTVGAQGFDRKNGAADQFILRSDRAVVGEIAERHGLELVDEIRDGSQSVALVRSTSGLDSDLVVNLLMSDSAVDGFELVQVASLPEQDADSELAGSEGELSLNLLSQGTFSSPCVDAEFASPVWSGYAMQWAAERLKVHQAQLEHGGCGETVIAVLDTGVDSDHELLRGSVISGFDFILNQAGIASDWSNLEHSISAVVEHSISAVVEHSISAVVEGGGDAFALNNSVSAILESSTSGLLESEQLPPAFGHGTMVAGIARLAAPGSAIMPLRAFDGNGHGHLFDIIRAIHFAVKEGADVINMSFSTPSGSKELQKAIEFATHRGVTCVAAVGNQGQEILVYPAAYEKSLGIASTGALDDLSQFSNFGPQLIDLGAPGEAIITAYPGGLYAAGWGTSFATPFVAGTAALIGGRGGQRPNSVGDIVEALLAGAEPGDGPPNDLGFGRLDMLASVIFAKR
jgi:subtilisin family serine protease